MDKTQKKERHFKSGRTLRKFFKELKKQTTEKTFEQWASENLVQIKMPPIVAKKQSFFTRPRFLASISTAIIMVSLAIILPFAVPRLLSGNKGGSPLPTPTGPSLPSTPVYPPIIQPVKKPYLESAEKLLLNNNDLYQNDLFIFNLDLFVSHYGVNSFIDFAAVASLHFVNEDDLEVDDPKEYYEGVSLELAYGISDLIYTQDFANFYMVDILIRTYENYGFTKFTAFHDLELLKKEDSTDVTVYYYTNSDDDLAFISFAYHVGDSFVEYFIQINGNGICSVFETILENLFGDDIQFKLEYEDDYLMEAPNNDNND